MINIVLASKSPRRHELFDILGINYTSITADINEEIRPGESPETAVKRIAIEKAEAVAKEVQGSIIVSADTIVVCNGKILGKPHDKKTAYNFLSQLSGKSHQVMTGLAVYNQNSDYLDAIVETTLVYFRKLTSGEIMAYIASNEPYDKAGAYGIQGLGALLVEKIEGCYFNVVGLPITSLYLILREQGVNLLGGLEHGGIQGYD